MPRFALLVVLVMLVITPGLSAAQTDPSAICSDPTTAQLEGAASEIDLTGACVVFTLCIESGQSNDLCQLRASVTLLETCADGDNLCVSRALLAAAALDPLYWDAYLPMADEPTVVNTLRTGWAAFSSADYAAAADAFTNVENSQNNPMLLLSRALAEGQAGNPEAALGTVVTALDHSPQHPLVRYGRLLLLSELGRTEDAAIAAYELAGFAAPDAELATFVESLQSAYPLDRSAVETWLLYPVQRRGGGPGGSYISDVHEAPPQPLSLQHLADGRVLLFDYFGESESWVSADVSSLVVRFPDAATFTSVEGYTTLTLSAVEGGYQLVRTQSIFESFSEQIGLLLPADAPDPRTAFTTIQCEYLSSLTPGQYVAGPPLEVSGAIDVFDAPGGGVADTVPWVRLLDSTECIEGTLWWSVEGGWVRVNDGDELLVWTESGLRLPLYCPNALPPRLGTLTANRVLPGAGAQLIRSEASPTAAEVGSLPEDTPFAVTSDPLCVDGTVWYAVEVEGLTGWVAESADGSYLMEPLPRSE